MTVPPRWKTLRSERIQHCRIFDVHRIRARSPRTGHEHTFFGIQSADWVNVIPLTPRGEVVMVHQYRHGSREISLETPGGIVDPGEAPATAAARELLEGTGYRADEIVGLGCLNPNPALFGNRLHGFLARGARPVAQPTRGQTEETTVELVPLSELRRRVATGDVDHALVIAVLSLLDLCGDEER